MLEMLGMLFSPCVCSGYTQGGHVVEPECLTVAFPLYKGDLFLCPGESP